MNPVVTPYPSENVDRVSLPEEKVEADEVKFFETKQKDSSPGGSNLPRNYVQVPSKPDDKTLSELQLQLFRKSNIDESGQKAQDQSYPLEASATEADETADNNHEAMFVSALIDAMTIASDSSINDGERKAADVLSSVLNRIDISDSLKSSMTMNVVSRLVSTAVDDVVDMVETRDAQVMGALGVLSNTMRAAQVVAPGLMLNYMGNKLGTETSLEDMYRRYAVYCMSTEQRLVEDLESLNEMQHFLDVRESKAQDINTEVAGGMFQMAVSAAMASGVVSDEDRRRLETLKACFGKYLNDTTADSIMKEVMAMRTMYALQQMVQQDNTSEKDVEQLQKMCHDLGGDIEEVVRNADVVGNALGVEVNDFAVRLRSILLGPKSWDKSAYRSTMP